jgi:hypothetical protein
VVWFSPELRVTYRPRPSLPALARQMYETGRWRREVVRRHPETASARYLAPPLAVVGIAGGSAAGALGLAAGGRWLRMGWLAPLGYLALILGGSALAPATLSRPARLRLPLVLATTHLSWGAGFLVGLPRRPSPTGSAGEPSVSPSGR